MYIPIFIAHPPRILILSRLQVDAVTLGKALQKAASVSEALALYNDDTVRRGEDLYRRSRSAARGFLPEGAMVLSPSRLVTR